MTLLRTLFSRFYRWFTNADAQIRMANRIAAYERTESHLTLVFERVNDTPLIRTIPCQGYAYPCGTGDVLGVTAEDAARQRVARIRQEGYWLVYASDPSKLMLLLPSALRSVTITNIVPYTEN